MNGLVRLSWQVTGAFLAATMVTDFAADSLDTVYAVMCAVAFIAGFGLFCLGFWNGVQRSRVELVTLPGLLAASTANVPKSLRNQAWLALIAQIVIAVVAASLRPFTAQAFGLLVPLFGLGINTLLGSRQAQFFPRDYER